MKDGGSPDARFRLARLRLNDGAKLWVSFKLCFKTNNFYCTYWRNILHVAVNFGAKQFNKFIAKYEPVSIFLINPIAVTCCSQLWC